MTEYRCAFSARQERDGAIDVVVLSDAARHMEVRVAPSVGNMAYSFLVHGKNILWFPFSSPAELRARPALCGVPFLAPWANRIDGDAYWVDGRQYRLNPLLGNLRRDAHGKPIHGLLNFSPAWILTARGADADSAYAASRLDFWRYPELMAQFPFAHEVIMTYRLAGGALQVETSIENHSASGMPVAIGYHPYFRLHDAPRDEWTVHLAARERWVLDEFLIPTGRRETVPWANPHLLRARPLDDVFGGLVADADGATRFRVRGQREELTVTYGPKYRVAVVYAPEAKDFICFEPMTAVSNAFNLAHVNAYEELQSIPPGGRWSESFWITPEGF
jgi:aldose 1-epimerase